MGTVLISWPLSVWLSFAHSDGLGQWASPSMFLHEGAEWSFAEARVVERSSSLPRIPVVRMMDRCVCDACSKCLMLID